jgi:formate dehydrogenase subunit gamma
MTAFQLASLIGLGGTALLAALHYAMRQPWRGAPPAAPRDIKRYALWERLVHAVTMLGFLVLLVTSFVPALWGRPLREFGWLLMIHTSASSLYFLGTLAMIFTWAEDCRFGRHDLEWLRRCPCTKKTPGVVSPEGPKGAAQKRPLGSFSSPADRFDPLQKLYFWFAAALGLALLGTTMLAMVNLFGSEGQAWLYEIHRWTALALTMATIAHAYRTTLAKPGTWRALVSGDVSAAWAKRHHPLWFERVAGRPAEKR